MAVAHPLGRPSEDWSYKDGRTVMSLVIEALIAESGPGSQAFSISFDFAGSADEATHLRRFLIHTPRGTVEFEPLDVSYDAAFGLCSVFRD